MKEVVITGDVEYSVRDGGLFHEGGGVFMREWSSW